LTELDIFVILFLNINKGEIMKQWMVIFKGKKGIFPVSVLFEPGKKPQIFICGLPFFF